MIRNRPFQLSSCVESCTSSPAGVCVRKVETVHPNYTVAGPIVPAPSRRRQVAVFVAHGMGQQIPYQTLDSIAESLRKRDELEGRPPAQPVARALKFEDWWLQRIELKLKSGL